MSYSDGVVCLVSITSDLPRINCAAARTAKKDYWFILPESFKPLEFLPQSLWTRADDARWLMSQVVRKTASGDVDFWDFARLHSKVINANMAKNHVRPIVDALTAGGAIKTAPHCAGVKSKGYSLGERYLDDRHVRVKANEPRFLERVTIEQERLEAEIKAERWRPIHYALDREQQHVSLRPEVDQILLGLPHHTLLSQSVLVDNIRRGEMPFTVSRYGRCFNGVTGLKRDVRAALEINKSPAGSLDIRCAQPALLAMLMDLNSPPGGLKVRETYKHARSGCTSCLACCSLGPDARAFADAAIDGSLYCSLSLKSGLDIADVKLALLRDVLAPRWSYPSAVGDVFRRLYPSVHTLIRAVNRDNHSTLIRLLQQTEAWLVVDVVSPKLLRQNVRFVTLHDAIFAPMDSLDAVKAAFDEAFEEIGFRLSLKRETCAPARPKGNAAHVCN